MVQLCGGALHGHAAGSGLALVGGGGDGGVAHAACGHGAIAIHRGHRAVGAGPAHAVFKILMLLIYITLLIVIIAFNPVRVVRYTLPCIFVITGGIYIFIANIIGNRCMAAVSNRYLGRTVFIDTQIAYRVMGVMCILAAASYVITLIYGMVVKNRRKRI